MHNIRVKYAEDLRIKFFDILNKSGNFLEF